ncbi:MAG: glycosyltransferase [Planctomycetes bacterium]|nr:glycosyltransferase [Planctomycetota bacterium]
MKVAFVTWKFPALANTFILNEIVEVLRRGFEVAIYSIDRSGDRVVHDDVGRYSLFDRTWFLDDFVSPSPREPKEFAEYSVDWLRERVTGFRAVADHMRRTGVDVVHGCFANNCSTVAMVTARLAGLPFTFECHAYDLFVDMRFADEKIAQVRRVFSISDYNRQYLVSEFGCDADKIAIRRVPILESFCDAIDAGERVPGLVVSVARLCEIKGFDVALDAFANVAAAVPEARFVIVGDGELRGELEARADRLGIRDKVRFAGSLTNQETLRLVRSAQVFVLPSRIAGDGDRDGIPTSMIEAMYLRTPTVSTRVSGIPELVDSGINGLLADPEDVPGIAEHLRLLLTDHALRDRMGDAAREKVKDEFGVDRNIDVLVDSWQAIAREPRSEPVRPRFWSRVRALLGR